MNAPRTTQYLVVTLAPDYSTDEPDNYRIIAVLSGDATEPSGIRSHDWHEEPRPCGS